MLILSTFLIFILGAPISYYPRERREGRGRGWKWGKCILPIMNETQVSVPGAFKLDHLQLVKLILFLKFSTLLTFILGASISYYPRVDYTKGYLARSPTGPIFSTFQFMFNADWSFLTDSMTICRLPS